MNLKTYLAGIDQTERIAFAKRAGTTDNYLKQLKAGHRSPSTRLCHRLVKASGGKLTLEELRPDIWRPKAA